MYNTLCFCNNIDALMGALGVQHIPSEWRLFIDSSKYNIKAVLLQNGNLIPPIPIAYSENLRESHVTMVILLEISNRIHTNGVSVVTSRQSDCFGYATWLYKVLLLHMLVG